MLELLEIFQHQKGCWKVIPLGQAVIARLSEQGHHFEILVDPKKAMKVKEGETISLDDVVASKDVYKDSAKGERAAEEIIKKVFNTNDFNEIAKKIIKKGEIQITTEQRHEMQKEKRSQIVTIIARESIDPRTNAPHPPARIEKAMEEAKVHVEPLKSAEIQIENVMEKLRAILPIKLAKVRIAIKVEANYAGKVYGYIHNLKIVKEEWSNDGSLIAVIEMPAGMQSEFYDKLNSMTHGGVETKILETV